MSLAAILAATEAAFPQRVGVGHPESGMTYRRLRQHAQAVAEEVHRLGANGVVLLDVNSEAVPVCAFGAAWANVPYIPLNYRLTDDQLRALLVRTAPTLAVVDDAVAARLGPVDNVHMINREALFALMGDDGLESAADPDGVAMILFTSGTTGEPKAALLRHRHLVAHIAATMRPVGAPESEGSLISAPPYHMAGAMGCFAAVYTGRRLVFLPQFTPESWIDIVQRDKVTHTMVVPTMLARILDILDETGERLPDLRLLTYGGGRMPLPLIERAMNLLPHVDFLNSYGLTETASAVAILTPRDHREVFAANDPAVRARLGSVGRPLRSLQVEIRDDDGKVLPPGVPGHVCVRGEQVSGEYAGRSAAIGDDGWLLTNDGGWLDEGGYLFVTGRLDDVIVRGGENISPNEIEDVLLTHPSVSDAGVVGMPDDEWGEVVIAAIVLTEGGDVSEADLQEWVRSKLRSSKVPARVLTHDALPYSDTGKLLRRTLKATITESGTLGG